MINSFKDDYFFLSNYYEAPVTYEGITYRNSEAAFQAQKCEDRKDKLAFAGLSAAEAKKLGRTVKLKPHWEDLKVGTMHLVVHSKFFQNEELGEKLLATGDEYLEEGNDWGDRIWGTVDGQGANLLGQILMEVRDELREFEDARDSEGCLCGRYDDGRDFKEALS